MSNLFSRRHFLVLMLSVFLSATVTPATGAGQEDLIIHGIDQSDWPAIKVFVNNSTPEHSPAKEDFTVTLDDVSLVIDRILSHSEANSPVALLISVDTSGTMKGKPLDAIKDSLRTMLSRKGAADQLALLTFNDDVMIDVPFTSDRAIFLKGVNELHTSGSRTVLFKAMFKGLEMLDNETLPPRKYMVVISDGKDEGLGYTLDDAINKAREMATPVFSLGYVTKAGRQYLDNMDRLARLTGGHYQIIEKSSDLSQAWQNMSGQVLGQLALQLNTNLAGDGKEHQLKVEYHSPSGKISRVVRQLAAPLTEKPVTEVTMKPEPAGDSKATPPVLPGSVSLLDTILAQPKSVLYAVGFGILLLGVGLIKLLTGGSRQPEISPRAEPALDEAEIVEPVEPVEPAATGWRLTIGQYGIDHNLLPGTITIGAHADNGIVIDEETISGYHAEISGNGEQWLVKDLGSTNGSYLNGNRLTEPTPVQAGDELKLGTKVIAFVYGPAVKVENDEQ